MRKRAREFQVSPNSEQKRKASCIPVDTTIKLNKQDLAICSGMTPSTSSTSNVWPSSFMFDNDAVIASKRTHELVQEQEEIYLVYISHVSLLLHQQFRRKSANNSKRIKIKSSIAEVRCNEQSSPRKFI